MEPTLPRPRGGFATRAVHGASVVPEVVQQPVSPAIWPSATWAMPSSAEVGDLLTDAAPGYVYGRYDNPTATTLHGLVASLHEAPAAWASASGTAAVHSLLSVLRGTGRILSTSRLYGGTWALFQRLVAESGWGVDHADLLTADDVRTALTDDHTLVYVETLANPSTAVADLAGMADVCREHGVPLVVDNTFASPYLCRPVELGATAVVESATKYLAGHGDAVAGVVAGAEDLIAAVREHTIELGGSLGPFEAWLVVRGIQTLPLRMRAASANALALARLLAASGAVDIVRYPGLDDHAQHQLATELFGGRGYGGVLSFDLPDRRSAEAFADACQVFARAASLGATHSLVLHPASTSHRQLDDDALAAAGLGPGTIRLAVGIEDEDDLLDDVRRALAAVEESGANR